MDITNITDITPKHLSKKLKLNSNSNIQPIIYDILIDIFEFIKSSQDLLQISSVCRLWNLAVFDSTPWKTMVLAHNLNPDGNALSKFQSLCVGGHLHMAKWFYTTFHLNSNQIRQTDNFVFRLTCYHGHFDVVKWLSEKLSINDLCALDNEAFRCACRKGHIQIAKWLCKKCQLTTKNIRKKNNFVFRWACANGHQDLAIWLVNRFQLTLIDISSCHHFGFQEACKNGYLEIAKWLYRVFYSTIKNPYQLSFMIKTLIKTCKRGHLQILQWIFSIINQFQQYSNSTYPQELFAIASKYNHLNILQWLHKTFHFSQNDANKYYVYHSNTNNWFVNTFVFPN